MFVPDLRCLPRRQSIPPAHPVRAGRPRPQDGSAPAHPVRAGRPRSQDGSAPAHPVRAGRPRSQDGTRCTAACGRDARTPRTVLDAPLLAGGTPALPGRHSMHRCLRVGRPRTQDGTRCTAACGRDARAPRVAPSTSRGRDARALRTALDAPLPAGGTSAHPGSHRPRHAGATPAPPGQHRVSRNLVLLCLAIEHCGRFCRFERVREQPSLPIRTRHRAEAEQLLLGFGSLGDDRHSQRTRQ